MATRWLVFLKGSKRDLMLLADYFKSPLLQIEASSDRFFLYSSQFDSMSEPAMVEEHAANLLLLASGVMFVETTDYHASVEVVTALLHEVGKPLPVVVTPDALELTLTTHRPTVLINGVATTPVDNVNRRVIVGQRNPAVFEAFQYLDHPQIGWPDLYKVFEVVRRDIGGQKELLKRDWEPEPEVSRFRQTANYYRHAKYCKYPLPAKPMTLSHARKFIRGLLRSLLAEKYDA